MATDILVRVAASRKDVGPGVLISALSQIVDRTTPENLLLVTGAWEPGLRAFAVDALRMVDADAFEGEAVSDGAIVRRAIAAPFTEHVSILQSRVGRGEAVAWLDGAYGRTSDVTILPTGFAIIGLLAGLVVMFRSVAGLLPSRDYPSRALSGRQLAIVFLAPTLATPLIAGAFNLNILPVLVAEYLGLHLLSFGGIRLVLLRIWGVALGRTT